jgi:hypothetical protein
MNDKQKGCLRVSVFLIDLIGIFTLLNRKFYFFSSFRPDYNFEAADFFILLTLIVITSGTIIYLLKDKKDGAVS